MLPYPYQYLDTSVQITLEKKIVARRAIFKKPCTKYSVRLKMKKRETEKGNNQQDTRQNPASGVVLVPSPLRSDSIVRLISKSY